MSEPTPKIEVDGPLVFVDGEEFLRRRSPSQKDNDECDVAYGRVPFTEQAVAYTIMTRSNRKPL